MSATVPVDLVDRLAKLLEGHHAGHLLVPIATVCAPYVQPRRRHIAPGSPLSVEIRLVTPLVKMLGQPRYDLLPQILWLLAPYITTAPGAVPSAEVTWPEGAPSDIEIRALDGVSQGLTNAQIAAQLAYSEDGLKSALQRLYRKLGADDRAQAVRRGFETGLLASYERAEVAS